MYDHSITGLAHFARVRHDRSRRTLRIAVLAVVLAAAFPTFLSHAGKQESNPLSAALDKAHAAGSYRFRTNLTQTSAPAATVLNAGRASTTNHVQLDGIVDFAAKAIEVSVSLGGEQGASSRSDVRVIDGVTSLKDHAGNWVPSTTSAAATLPAGGSGDLTGYLRTARNIIHQDGQVAAGQASERYTFDIDGAAFAALLSAHSDASGHPVAIDRGATGTGEMWVGADGLPMRTVLAVRLTSPDGSAVTLDATVQFSEFATARVPGVAHVTGGSWRAALSNLDLLAAVRLFLVALMVLLLSTAAVRWLGHAKRRLTAASTLLFMALVAGQVVAVHPSASAATSTSPSAQAHAQPSAEAQPAATAQPAANVQPTATGVVTADPHRDPLASVASPSPKTPINIIIDTDADGLTDFVEERIGTEIDVADSDNDGVSDTDEVNGYSVGGACAANSAATTMWYGDPMMADSNADGISDGREWAADTDGDCTPDLFDTDNDNDGIPDRIDSAPTRSGRATTYSSTQPLNLQLDGLTTSQTLHTFVDFQIQPLDQRELRLSLRPMDWPADKEGQIRDLNASSDDMTLIPMLEITVPAAHVLPSATELTNYGIQVGPAAADGSRPAYVPLTLLKDSESGADVAFAGRMVFNSDASWATSQQVRLTWLVQVLNDVPCDPKAADAAAVGCTAAGTVGGVSSGFIYDLPQVVQTYYTDWTLAGLSVSEEHGTQVAVAYEDPSVDQDVVDNSPSWTLNTVLVERFLGFAPGATTHEITTSNVASLLDRRVAADSLYGLPNTFDVQGPTTYPTMDAALHATDSTTIPSVLDNAFGGAGSNAQPWITTLYSSSSRSLSIDAGTGYVNTLTAAGQSVLQLNLAYGDGTPTQVTSGVKAVPFCDTGVTPRWRACTLQQVWDEIDRLTGTYTYDPENPEIDATGIDATVAAGQRRLAHINAAMMMTGQNVPTQITTTDGRVTVLNESHETARRLRTVAGMIGRVGLTKIGGFIYLRELAAAASRRPAEMLRALGTPLGVRSAQPTQILKPLLTRMGLAGKAAIAVGVITYLSAAAVLGAKGNSDERAAGWLMVRVFTSALSVAVPVLTGIQFAELLKQAAITGTATRAVLAGSTQRLLGVSAKWSAVGARIAIVVSWGFFLYQMGASDTPAFSPEFNKALADVISSSLYIGLTVALGASVVGLLIVGVVAAIDAIAALVCEAQKIDECFSISGAITKAIGYVLFGTDPMVNVNAPDLVTVGVPKARLNDVSLGYVAGNSLTVTLPVDTTITHSEPSAWQMSDYMWFYSQSNIRSGNFHHELSAPNATTAAAASSPGNWDTVTVAGLARYRATKHEVIELPLDKVITLDRPGINRSFPISLNSSYTLPSYECWTALFIPVCYKRSIEGTTSSTLNSFVYDVLPATLGDFTATTASGALAWDPAFQARQDADGDGLLARTDGGLDPSDAAADSDSDGLGDARELQLQADGIPVSPLSADADGDGLTDDDEVAAGSNPSLADTDNDGLSDSVEVRHVAFDANGKPYVAGGWDISVDGRTITVFSDPTEIDSDHDGLSDGAEKALASATDPADRVDDQQRPYHPMVANSSPITIEINASNPSSFVKAGDSIDVVTKVTATTPLAPSVLDITLPAGDGPAPAASLLPFDPDTFVDSQSSEVTNSISIPAGVADVDVTADVRAWLPSDPAEARQVTVIGGGPVSSGKPIQGQALGAAGGQFLLANEGVANGGLDVTATNLVTGSAGALDPDDTRIPGTASPAVACNDSGNCLTLWNDAANCGEVGIYGVDAPGQRLAIYLNRHPDSSVTGYTSISQLELLWNSDMGWPSAWTTSCGNANIVVRDMTNADIQLGHYMACVVGPTLCLNGNEGIKGWPISQSTWCDATCNPPNRTEFLNRSRSAFITLDVHGSENQQALTKRLTDTAGNPLTTAGRQLVPSAIGEIAIASDGDGFGVAWRDSSGGWFQRYNSDGTAVSRTSVSVGSELKVLVVDGHYVVASVEHSTDAINVVATDMTTGAVRTLATQPPSEAQAVTFDLAYSPTTGAAMLVLAAEDGRVEGWTWQHLTDSAEAPYGGTLFAAADVGSPSDPHVALHPATGEWMVTVNTPVAGLVRVTTYTHQMVQTDGYTNLTASGLTSVDLTNLSCPSITPPLVDLRFEELPGTTTFADSSGAGHAAVGSAATAPDAGAVGAPGALNSHLAATFQPGDELAIANPADPSNGAGDVSIAFWYRRATGASDQTFVIDSDPAGSSGYGVRVSATGAVTWHWGSKAITAAQTVGDGEWHFIAASRRSQVGKLQLQIDSTPLVTDFGADDTLTNTTPLAARADGSPAVIDQLQLFNAAIGTAQMSDIRDRVAPTCMTTATQDRASTFWWKLGYHQRDTRGAALTASAVLALRVDAAAPASAASVPSSAFAGSSYVLAGDATDGPGGSGIAAVEVSIDGGPWTLANGFESWTLPINLGAGDHQIVTRATDAVGNVEVPGPGSTLRVDAVAPQVTLSPLPSVLRPAVDAATGQLHLTLSGTAADAESGLEVGGVEVAIVPTGAVNAAGAWQAAGTLDAAGGWTIDYVIPASLGNLTGSYTISARAIDRAGNRSADNAATRTAIIDSTGPAADLQSVDRDRKYLAGNVTISGTVTDIGGAGVAAVDVSLTPLENVVDPTFDPANRTWLPATLAAADGTAVSTSWTLPVPPGVEGHFQLDLRSRDSAGNEQVTDRVWSGIIDTRAPRLTLTVTPTGKVRPRANRYEIGYVCAADDLFLDVKQFNCPGATLQPSVREFLEPSPLRDALEAIFPDAPVLTRLSSSYAMWERTETPSVTIRSCDLFGNCASAAGPVQPASPLASFAPPRRQALPSSAPAQSVSGSPVAVVVSPTPNQHVAAESGVTVQVAAEATGLVKTIHVLLDGVQVAERQFTAESSTEQYEEAISIPVAAGGIHTLAVTVDDWAGATASSGDTQFFADMARPALTIDTTPITLDRTWAVGTDFVRFSGTVSDDGTIALVQSRVDDGPWVDATFGEGTWTTAVHVPNVDGSTIALAVRASDLAGNTSEISGTTTVDLTPPGNTPYVRPDTRIVIGPGSGVVGASSFTVAGSAGDRQVVELRCQVDDLPAARCDAAFTLTDVAIGRHVLTATAIDEAGYGDLTPATWTWSVAASGPQPVMGSAPADPTDQRTATFSFSGPGGARFECSFDGGEFDPCTSPTSYPDVAAGEHTFQVRATVGDITGSPVRHHWTVVNRAPVAASQAIVVRRNDDVGQPITLAADDVDPLTFHVVEQPRHGFIEGVAPNLRYVPFTGYVGPDEFSFVADDGQLVSSPAIVHVLVTSGGVAPVVTVPGTIRATAPSGQSTAEVSFVVTATDSDTVASAPAAGGGSAFGGKVPVVCTPPSGSRFPVGETTVNCTATDVDGNIGTASFLVIVSTGTPSGPPGTGGGTGGGSGGTTTTKPGSPSVKPGESSGLPATGGGFSLLRPATLIVLIGCALVLLTIKRRRRGTPKHPEVR